MAERPGIEQVEKQLHALAEGVEQDSALWIYLNFLDDLVNGFLAYKPLRGNVERIDEILDHDALVVVWRENGGSMATYVHGASEAHKASCDAMLSYLVHTLPGSEEFPAVAFESLPYTGREVVAAITMSRATSERPAVMLFYLPQFDEATIFAALKGAIKL